MFRRIFCHAKVAPHTPMPDGRGESSPHPSKSMDKDKTKKPGFSLRCLFSCLWKKVQTLSKPKKPKPEAKRAKVQVSEAQTSHQKRSPVMPKKKFDLSSFGLPNIGNSCYVNASVQSIMNIAPFMDRICAQEDIWKHCKKAKVLMHLKALTDLRKSRFNHWINPAVLMHSFKQIIASKASEFCGGKQKDAHEFLTVLIKRIQSLAPTLQMSASSLGMVYHCPVQDMMRFGINRTRTCKRCGIGSSRREFMTNISLDVQSHSTIDLLLQEYLRETYVEFRCNCGGQMSSLKSSFETLPNVLILHLKRFRFASTYHLKKVTDDVHLNRDLVVSSREDAGCFSLMGVLSHIGPSAYNGHYIFDGRSPANNCYEPIDRWLQYNDSCVHETSGRAVCKNRQKTAYILFYQRVNGD